MRSPSPRAGAVYAVGYFDSYRSAPAHRLIKVDGSTGELDTIFTQSPAASLSGLAASLFTIVPFGGELYLGGGFDQYREEDGLKGVARLDPTTGNPIAGLGLSGSEKYCVAIAASGSTLYLAREWPGDAFVEKTDASGNVDTLFVPPIVRVLSGVLAVIGSRLYAGTSDGWRTFNSATGQLLWE